jgi:hypothetical protein
MNAKLLTEQERRDNQRARDHRKHLKMEAKRRASLLKEAAVSPPVLAAIEAGLLNGNDAITLLQGTSSRARKVLLLLQGRVAAVSETCGRGGAAVTLGETRPGRMPTLRRAFEGVPRDLEAVLSNYRGGLRANSLLVDRGYLPRKAQGFAFLTKAELLGLLPGLRFPARARRREYLVRLSIPTYCREPALEIYSRFSKPLFQHRLPKGWTLVLRQCECGSRSDCMGAKVGTGEKPLN